MSMDEIDPNHPSSKKESHWLFQWLFPFGRDDYFFASA